MTPQEVTELEDWFKNVELPKAPIMLFQGTEIADVNKFLEAQFISLRHDPASKINAPIIYRLKTLKLLIEANL
ncbi:MAG: hypothetical protein J7577_00950 [Sphingobacteriaceae bacterium]|nr:hypothetical protein [Sphingobacteriaceae bacterium]